MGVSIANHIPNYTGKHHKKDYTPPYTEMYKSAKTHSERENIRSQVLWECMIRIYAASDTATPEQHKKLLLELDRWFFRFAVSIQDPEPELFRWILYWNYPKPMANFYFFLNWDIVAAERAAEWYGVIIKKETYNEI